MDDSHAFRSARVVIFSGYTPPSTAALEASRRGLHGGHGVGLR